MHNLARLTQPHPATRCRLEAAQLPDKLTVTNGSNAKQRLLLRNAAVQLEDEYGNAAPGGGVQVCWGGQGLPVEERHAGCVQRAGPHTAPLAACYHL